MVNNIIRYTIGEPIWDGDKVGIADFRVVFDTQIEVKLDYEDKHGNLVHPHLYVMDCAKVRTYPTQKRKGVRLYLVPIADFKVAVRK